MASDSALVTRQDFNLLLQRLERLQSSEVSNVVSSNLGIESFADHASSLSWIIDSGATNYMWLLCLTFFLPFLMFLVVT